MLCLFSDIVFENGSKENQSSPSMPASSFQIIDVNNDQLPSSSLRSVTSGDWMETSSTGPKSESVPNHELPSNENSECSESSLEMPDVIGAHNETSSAVTCTATTSSTTGCKDVSVIVPTMPQSSNDCEIQTLQGNVGKLSNDHHSNTENTINNTNGNNGMEISPSTSFLFNTDDGITLTCDICNETFLSKSFYDIHLQSHNETLTQYLGQSSKTIWSNPTTVVKKKGFLCTICKSQCFNESHLKIHQLFQSGHKPSKSLSCDVCWKTFTKPSDLKRHQRIHTGEKPFTCSVCGKKFSRADYLKAHHSTHAEKKPFSCNVCKKRFSQSGTLSRHKLTHTEDQPFACNICWKAFADIGDLKLHQFTHTEEKPYCCNICTLKFDTSSDLNTHLLSHSLTSSNVAIESS